jgi:serine phosphatase RsbU (regulator of sigma subunit)
MTRHEILSPDAVISYGVASRPMPGEPVTGDLHLVRQVGSGVLLAVMDGLGHGSPAAAAAAAAVAELDRHADEGLAAMILHCHEALYQTRGVVMTLARVEPKTHLLTWLGVGNVEGVLLRAGGEGRMPMERPLLRSGVVGSQLPALSPRQARMLPGDLLLLATDGIRPGFSEGISAGAGPQVVADQILKRYARNTDDALVLAAQLVEARHE